MVHLVQKYFFAVTHHLTVNMNYVAFFLFWNYILRKKIWGLWLLKNDGDFESGSWI